MERKHILPLIKNKPNLNKFKYMLETQNTKYRFKKTLLLPYFPVNHNIFPKQKLCTQQPYLTTYRQYFRGKPLPFLPVIQKTRSNPNFDAIQKQ